MHSAFQPRGVTALLLLLSLLVLLCGTGSSSATTYIATPLATHVLNITLNAPGWSTDATTLAAYASSLTSTVNTTICGSLPSTVTKCNAFMMAVSATSSPVQVAVQASAQTASYSAGNGTYNLFSQWAAGTNLFSLAALAGTLSTPTYSSGAYTVPCRGSQTYAFIPACSAEEAPSTTVYVQTSSSTNLQATFLGYLCPSGATTTCTASVAVTSTTNNYQVVTITGTSKGLEATLAFVADARASYLGSSSATSAITGETVGSSSAGLSVTRVELHYGTVVATLFSTTENERTYMSNVNLSLQCESSYSMWAIAFVVIPFLAIGLFRYVWYRGRRRAKKHERRRIVEDETRIMQGYTNPAGTQAVETAPPPGVDTSAVAPQWVMDENGNYYDANAASNGPAPGTGGEGGNDVTYQTWVDPETGETYQYVVDNSAAATDATQQQQQQQQAQPAAIAPAASAGDANVTYQTYTDPNTGETYQYAVDPSSTEAAPAPAAGDGAQQTADANVTYQTYVDPDTGETYQYAVDPTSTTAEAEPTAQDGTEAANAAAAAPEGYQTYVDPETGETYQYATADTGAEGQQYEYVDPETGETYVYDAATAAAQGEAGADAAAGADGTTNAATDGSGAVAGSSTYVDPNTGETYQYEADPNGGEMYQYVDPETGETYQYQDPNAAQ